MTELELNSATATPHAEAPAAHRRAGFRRALTAIAVIAIVLPLLGEAALRLTLGGAFLSPPVFRAEGGALGYRLLPAVTAPVHQFGRTVTVSTDGQGRRSTPGASTVATRRVHLVGDSQVFGWGLGDDETMSAQLQRLLGPGFEVVNHGVPGYGPDQYVEVLKGIPVGDQVIVIHTEENDGADAYKLFKPNGVSCSFISSFDREGPLRCALMNSRLVQGAFVLWNQANHRYYMTPLGFSEHSGVAGRVLYARIAEDYRDQLAQRAGRLSFTVVPWKGRYSKEWRSLSS